MNKNHIVIMFLPSDRLLINFVGIHLWLESHSGRILQLLCYELLQGRWVSEQLAYASNCSKSHTASCQTLTLPGRPALSEPRSPGEGAEVAQPLPQIHFLSCCLTFFLRLKKINTLYKIRYSLQHLSNITQDNQDFG